MRNLVLRWVKRAWPEIPEEMMKKSFKTCRISNALDCTENDNIYTYEMPKLTDDEMAWDDKFETDSKEEEE